MKFKAVIIEGEYMREFQNIVQTLSKLSKECIIELQNDHMQFIANEESSSTAPLVWVEIDTKVYFSEYTLRFAIDTQTKCMFSVSPVHLCRALGLLRSNARQCKFRLVNQQTSCLRIEVEVLAQNQDQTRQIIHDVPITIVPRSDWSYYDVPQKPNSTLVLKVPCNRLMRALIDKMKNITPTIIFHATSGGELNIVSETEMATITTHYTHLYIKELNPSKEERSKNQIESSCPVDCKKLAIFFSALNVPNGELACGIDKDRLIHFEVNIRPGIVIHSILPAVCM